MRLPMPPPPRSDDAIRPLVLMIFRDDHSTMTVSTDAGGFEAVTGSGISARVAAGGVVMIRHIKTPERKPFHQGNPCVR